MLQKVDVAIIGAGPVGLFTVFQCGMLGLNCAVFDTQPHVGGQCATLYPEKPIYDIPAYPKIMGAELVAQLQAQAAPFKPHYYLGQQVNMITQQLDGQWILHTSHDVQVVAGVMVIAGGAGAFGPNRPPLADLDEYEGVSVFYAVPDRQKFAGKKLVIAGGGDSAVDWAISLSEIAQSVTLVHRRDKFKAAPASLSQLDALAAQGKITLAVPQQLHGLEGKLSTGQISYVVLQDLAGNISKTEADVLLPFYGLATDLGPIATWGLNLNRQQVVVNPATCATNVGGIYCVGDMASYEGKLKLILQGFSEAAMAAHDIFKLLRPDAPHNFEHSTDKGVPVL
jgi:thioredoxin reductase (NADPH)